MLIAYCPNCNQQVPYLSEQTGMTGLCPSCRAEVVFQQHPMQIAGAIVGVVLACLSLGALGFFGVLGGIAALSIHGIGMLVVVVFAVISGMKIRTILLIFAIYLGAVVFVNMPWRTSPGKKADGAVASPYFAGLPK